MTRAATLIGAGLAGALLATLLARRGFRVEVFEKRSDPRASGYAGGRSINLALAERGLEGLRRAGLADAVMAQVVMMRGRMVHALDGALDFQPYGRDDSEVIWSVHRGRLNLTLLDAAEAAGARIHFGQALAGVDFERGRARFAGPDGTEREVDATSLIGADGAGSALRAAMDRAAPLGERIEPLGHAYRELEIPPAADGGFRIEPNALHIWPRGGYMCIALPNVERSFTVTLFLPNEGEPSFASVRSPAEAHAFFARDFADALAHIPALEDDWAANPAGMLATLYLERWHHGGRALLIGDAAHAIVPFHGQGMNCAFEDCVELDALLAASSDTAAVYAEFQRRRKPNAEAIAAMAIENYIEMRDRVDDPDFLLKKRIERALAERHPGVFVPRYGMVTFTRVPYAIARARGAVQAEILDALAADRTRFEDIDLARGDQLVRERLGALAGRG